MQNQKPTQCAPLFLLCGHRLGPFEEDNAGLPLPQQHASSTL